MAEPICDFIEPVIPKQKHEHSGEPMNSRISRRSFLQNTALAVTASSLPTIALGQSQRVEQVGLQLYTLRRELSEDFEGTLAKVSELGYKEMEFAGYYNRSAGEIRRILDANGMTSPAAHIQLAAVRADIQREIDFAAELGQQYIVVPFLAPNERTYDDYQRLVETLNSAGEACKNAGLKIGYHNHSFEFEPTNGIIPFDYILAETDPDLVDMELDLYWLANAEVDPLAYFQNHPGRWSMLHVKDMDSLGRMAPVGTGAIDFAEIFSYASTGGFKHYFVEHDFPGDGIASISQSIYTLRNIRF